MSNRNLNLGGASNWSDGDVLYAADLNDTFNATLRLIGSVYTGSDFNSTRGGGSGTTTGTHTIQLSASDLTGCSYIFVKLNYAVSTIGASQAEGSATIKVERNETSQSSWSDVLATTTLSKVLTANPGTGGDQAGGCFDLAITLTSGEKTNGIDIKFTSTSVTEGAGDSASYTNKQVYFLGGN